MEPEEMDAPEVLETPEEELDLTLEDSLDTDEEKVELQNQVEELKKKNAQLFERAKKNESKGVETKSETPMSTTDLYALMNAKVAEEDIQEVQEYASFKRISVAEALKSPALKSILALAKEERDVAGATNTGPTRRQVSTQTSDSLLEDATKGKLPDSDAGLTRLAEARLERRREATKRN